MLRVVQLSLLVVNSVGSRTHLGAQHSATNVIDSISSLLGGLDSTSVRVMDEIKTIASQQETPGVSANFTKALQVVMTAIKDTIEPMVKSHYTTLQSETNTAITTLTSLTNTATGQKTAADTADDAWIACAQSERALVSAAEAAAVALSSATEAEKQPCADQQAKAPFSSSLTLQSFTCDHSIAKDCSNQLTNYQTTVKGQVDGVKDDLKQKKGLYDAAKKRCDAAKAHTKKMKGNMEKADSDVSSKKLECTGKLGAKKIAMCQFGTDLQNKCAQVDVYNNLKGQLNGQTGEKSLQSLEQEWATVQLTECMLGKVLQSKDIDSTTLSSCKTTVNAGTLEKTVAPFDKKETEFQALTAPAKFTCQETSITFSGFDWTRGTKSSDFKKTAASPAVCLKNCPGQAFTVCGLGGQSEQRAPGKKGK